MCAPIVGMTIKKREKQCYARSALSRLWREARLKRKRCCVTFSGWWVVLLLLLWGQKYH